MSNSYQSWGKVFYPNHTVLQPYFLPSNQGILSGDTYLAYGNGRSYGDVCFNNGHHLIDTRHLDRYIEFDSENHLITCQAGIQLSVLLTFLTQHNYFVPVSPGTANVTLGGMIANDVHGKNHHKVASFGNHVVSMTLLRSDDGIVKCSKEQNADLFYATIGGMGLTGLILDATIAIKPVTSRLINVENFQTHSLAECLALFDDSDEAYEYTVAWLDMYGRSPAQTPGVFSRGNHATQQDSQLCRIKRRKVPPFVPGWLLNKTTSSLFNKLYYRVQRSGINTVCYHDFFYPLDKLDNWNTFYGKKGFFQYQFVVPYAHFESVYTELTSLMSRYKQFCYLAVLKKFGTIPSEGMMSFSRQGYTLAMDFPNKGPSTLAMFNAFDDIIMQANGALYAAKDARMGSDIYQKAYPRIDEFTSWIDPKFHSDFWSRVCPK